MKRHILGVLAGFGLALSVAIVAQQSGSGLPGGSTFSTQYRLNASTFGGAGPGTAGQVLTSNGAGAAPTFQATGSPAGAALTRTDDTNVTLTLGGTPATALLQATSITAGWTGTLAAARGGLGMATVTDDTVAVANGTAWESKAVPNCTDTGGNHLNYTAASNAFSCGTSGGSAPTTGSFTITWDDACTTSPTTAVDYTQSGDVVTWRIGTMSGTNCTSDSTAFQTTSAIVPSGIRPTVELLIPINQVKNNSVDVNGCMGIRTNGTVYVEYNGTAAGQVVCVGAAWTAANNKNVAGYVATSLTYKQ